MNAQPKKTQAPAQATAKPAVKVQPASKAAINTVKTAAKSSQPASQGESQKTSALAAPKKAVPAKPAAPLSKAAVSPKAPPSVAPAKASGLKTPMPLKPGRRSSARVAIPSPPNAPMVPTHAPDAAKASYSTMTERLIAPPIQAAAKKDPKLANNWKTKPGDQLTDDEIRAMPDSEYMNDKQLAFFRHKLSVLKQEIHASAGATTEHLREDAAVVPDPADRATIEEEHALELRTRDRERKLLKKIEQSIARIDSGDYGYCDETGEPIGVGRLIARPTANLSLEAQQRREIKQKMFGD
ncbi:RNA polymerase-binding protein DksA [Polaromonas sp.]|uniref:RNA polymerase-binding protein DksA n=1 Tax=Polaromonas sp. TaxID=1869339 RepID=UPI001DF7BF9D|nr:RNA polymerase-binding protein DksA [Polaromonas sp.]MBT9474272.1 RNA polymerase-binding protein DksA [Polaromonas sp.]